MQRPPVDYSTGSSSQQKIGQWVIDSYVSDICPEDHVIDIGCGTGETSFYLQQKFNCRLTVVDASQAMVHYVKERFPSERVVAEHIDIQDGNLQEKAAYDSKFSLATSFFALHWVRDIDTALGNIYWLLKPGGRTVLLIPIYPEPCKLFSAITMRIMEYPRWKNRINFKELENMSFPWPLASVHTSKGVYWLTEKNAFRDKMSKHGFDVVHYEITTREFPMTKAAMKGMNPVQDLIPEPERDEFLEDFMNILEEIKMADGHTGDAKEEITVLILVAVKRLA